MQIFENNLFPGETRASTMLNILQIYLYIQLKFTTDLGIAEYQQNVAELAAGASVCSSYSRERMKVSRLYSESYCSASQRSLRFSRTDFMLAFPEVELSAFSALPS